MGKVNMIGSGRSGKIQYVEGSLWKKKTYEFYWEYGGGDTMVIVWFPTEEKWDAQYPWASGRQKEIVTDMANQIRRKEFPSSEIRWQDGCFSLVKGS